MSEADNAMNEAFDALHAALGRIQGIADADRGLMLGEYGFRTIKDSLYDARRALDAIDDEISGMIPIEQA